MVDTPYRLIRGDEAHVFNMSNLISCKTQQSADISVYMIYDSFMRWSDGIWLLASNTLSGISENKIGVSRPWGRSEQDIYLAYMFGVRQNLSHWYIPWHVVVINRSEIMDMSRKRNFDSQRDSKLPIMQLHIGECSLLLPVETCMT